jgi:hypothetical protein
MGKHQNVTNIISGELLGTLKKKITPTITFQLVDQFPQAAYRLIQLDK